MLGLLRAEDLDTYNYLHFHKAYYVKETFPIQYADCSLIHCLQHYAEENKDNNTMWIETLKTLTRREEKQSLCQTMQ